MGTRGSAVALFLLALGVYALQSAVLPAYPGRDMSRYVQAFLQLGYEHPVLPSVMNTRGPLASLGVGVPLELGGAAAEIWLAALYAASIVAWAAVGLVFGARTAVLTAGALLVYPGYGILFHELASDSLFAAAFAGWALLLSRALLRPSLTAFVLLGLGMGALVLVRPPNRVLIVFALLPLLLRASWSRRLQWAAGFFIASSVVTQAWYALNDLRYGDAVGLAPSKAILVATVVLLPLLFPPPWRRRSVALVGTAILAAVLIQRPAVHPLREATAIAQLPSSRNFLFRVFITNRSVAPENGPASRELARAVERDLLTKEPYRSYGVDLDEFLSSGSNRVFGDLLGLPDDLDLNEVTREAIRRHPGPFFSSIGRTVFDEFWTERMYAPFGESGTSGEETASSGGVDDADTIVINGRRLPKPTGGEPIPSSHFGPEIWTLHGDRDPHRGAREVWMSPTEHPLVFDDPRDERRYEKFERETDRLTYRIHTRQGNPGLTHRLNQASKAFPPPLVWLAVGLLALALRRPRNVLVALAPAAAGVAVIVATSLFVYAVAQYAAPVTPAFILLAAAGLLGAHPQGQVRSLWLPATRRDRTGRRQAPEAGRGAGRRRGRGR